MPLFFFGSMSIRQRLRKVLTIALLLWASQLGMLLTLRMINNHTGLARPISDKDISPMTRQDLSKNLEVVACEIIISAILFSVVFLILRKRIVQGCDNFTKGAGEIASGNLDYRIQSDQKDEFSTVGDHFNQMATNLSNARTEIEQQNAEIRKQQELAETLLLNVLPPSVAAELKEKGAVDPRYHDDVTILFTDFQGFTLSTEKLAAEELVSSLHEYFTAFDKVIHRHGLEKLKTIGDSYMCVAGLPERRASHAVDALLAAFEIIEEVRSAHAKGLPPWSIRIGVHTGPVISGVVGIRKFAYDIWGESVNFASRMESSGSPGRVNLSATTYSKVKDFFECEARGKVATKEGREFEMYFAVGPVASLNTPEAFSARYEKYFQRKLAKTPGEAKSIGKTV
jgi:class 3 adenylate cyclase